MKVLESIVNHELSRNIMEMADTALDWLRSAT